MANVITLDVYQVGNFPVKQGNTASISIDFPASLIFAQETNITVSGVQMNSFVVFNGQQYYVAETVAQIETAANAGGGGGPTIYTGDGDIPIGTTRTVGVYSHLTDNTILDFIAKNEGTDTFPYAKIRIIGGNTGDAEPSIAIFTTDETGGSMSATYYDGVVTYSDTKAQQTAIQYGGDYSGSPAFTARSIPDKGYVDGKFSGGATKGPFTNITSITVVNGLITDLQGS